MAGDWIKMRVNLVTHPKVMHMAEILLQDHRYLKWSGLAYGLGGWPPDEDEEHNERHAALRITRYVVVTSLLRFWSYANDHAKAERIERLSQFDVDEIAGTPGFGEAVASAGWAEFDAEGGVRLPGFAEHNTSVEQRKTSGAERQKAYRQRLKERQINGVNSDVTGDVTNDVTLSEREDKRREEITPRKASATASVVVFENVSDSIRDEWLALRKKLRAPVTQRVVDTIAKEALKAGMTLEQALAKCCDRGWRGFEAKWLDDKVVSIKTQQQDDALQSLFRRGASL